MVREGKRAKALLNVKPVRCASTGCAGGGLGGGQAQDGKCKGDHASCELLGHLPTWNLQCEGLRFLLLLSPSPGQRQTEQT